MSGSSEKFAAVAIAVLMAGALAASGRALSAARERARQIERRYADWRTLRTQTVRIEADRTLLAEAGRAGGAPPLAEWLRAQRPDWSVDVKELERERIDGDWSLRRLQVTIARARLADLGETLGALSRLPVPWRAVELNLTALDATPGVARAILVLEGLARAPAAAP